MAASSAKRSEPSGAVLIASSWADAIDALAGRLGPDEAPLAPALRKAASDLREAVRAPGVTNLEPLQGAEVPADQPVRVDFAAEVDPGSVELVVVGANGRALKGASSYDPETRQFTFVPTNGFTPGAEYRATLSAARSSAGWELPREESWTFTGRPDASEA